MFEVRRWSELQAMRWSQEDSSTNPEVLYLEDRLYAQHRDSNEPLEPYSGVTALFNADLRTEIPREDWQIITPEKIVYAPTLNDQHLE